MADQSVGSIVGYLRIDDAAFRATADKAERRADELGRMSPTITVKASTEAAIAKMAAVAAAAGRLQTAQDKISDSQAKFTASTKS